MKCHIYAQQQIAEKILAYNTVVNYQNAVKKVIPIDLEMPLTAQKANELLSKIVNPNSRRSMTIAINSIFGLELKKPKAVKWEGDMPSFEALDALIQTHPKIRMYGNLMLHAGFRISETLVKQRIKGVGIMVESQLLRNGEIQQAKTMGQVIPPTWLMDEYRDWQPKYINANSLGIMFHRLFKSNGMQDMSAHKLRHCFATHYSKMLSVEGLRKQMRHTNIQTTMAFYVHVSDEEISSVMHTRPLRAIS
jgi:hypothetical protein